MSFAFQHRLYKTVVNCIEPIPMAGKEHSTSTVHMYKTETYGWYSTNLFPTTERSVSDQVMSEMCEQTSKGANRRISSIYKRIESIQRLLMQKILKN